MNLWFELLLYTITVSTNLVQFYLLWLIRFQSTRKIRSFRFALFCLMLNETLFTITVGYVMDPDLLFPWTRGAIANGLARYLGKDGGRIAFSIALFFGAGVFWNQVYCLLFRYTAIQQRFDHLHKWFNGWPARLGCTILGYVISAFCAVVAYCSLFTQEETLYMFRTNFAAESADIDANAPLMVVGDNGKWGVIVFGVFILGGLCLVSVISITFSISIYRTISVNASCFTARTYRLHRQLTLLLIVEFFLPVIFLVAPVLYAAASVVFLFPIGKPAGDLSVLLLSLYTMTNSLCTLWFVAPYREYTLRVLRLSSRAGSSTAGGQQGQRHNLALLKSTVAPLPAAGTAGSNQSYKISSSRQHTVPATPVSA